jgi:hypothetical protein
MRVSNLMPGTTRLEWRDRKQSDASIENKAQFLWHHPAGYPVMKDAVDYKVSIIMTTREGVARVMKNIRSNLKKEGGEEHARRHRLLQGRRNRKVKFKYATHCEALK